MSEQALNQVVSKNMIGFAIEETATRKTTILSQQDGFEVRLVEETRVNAATGKPIGSYCAKCTVFDDGSVVYIPIECPIKAPTPPTTVAPLTDNIRT